MKLEIMLLKKIHIVPCERSGEEVSFGWSHHRFLPSSLKLKHARLCKVASKGFSPLVLTSNFIIIKS